MSSSSVGTPLKSIIKSPNSSSTSVNGDSSSKKKVKFYGGTIYHYEKLQTEHTKDSSLNSLPPHDIKNISVSKRIKNCKMEFQDRSDAIRLSRERLKAINSSVYMDRAIRSESLVPISVGNLDDTVPKKRIISDVNAMSIEANYSRVK
jgi:hypothetical protein